MVRVRAPELPQTLPWLNCDRPLSLKALRGYVVLLDFWTYGCINCLHVIPDLKYLEQKYGDRLVVIGVHTAKFDHEQNPASIQQAMLRYGITHPVVVDGDRKLWDQYAVRAYPTFVLIDPQGYIVTMVSGEGRRSLLDQLIQQLLEHQLSEHQSSEHQLLGQDGTAELDEALWRSVASAQTLMASPLAFPGGILADVASDTLFIADTGHHRIVVTTLNGELKAVIGTGNPGWMDGDRETAQFFSPQGMAFDPVLNTLYVADTGNHLIRKIDLNEYRVSTLAGTGTQGRVLFPHGGQALEVDLNSPWDLVQVDQLLYFTLAGAHQLWLLDLGYATVQTFMGTGAEFCVDGPPEIAAFAQPSGITSDGKTLWIADSETSTIRAVHLEHPPLAATVCGSGQLFEFGDRDSCGLDVRLQHCLGITQANGTLWIVDTYNHKIKQINPLTGVCKTLLGFGSPGFQDGMGREAQFAEPAAICSAQHQLYVADTNNHAIRKVNLNTLEVTTLSIPQLCSPSVCLPF